MAQTQNIPVLVLPEGTQRTKGKDAARMNILAARTVAEVVKATLGPKGMDKMLVDTLGDVVVTNDGVTILEEMEIQHPTAKMMVEVAKVQGEEIGDGTTTAVMIAGELLRKAEDLIDQQIHPTVIVKGYRTAAAKVQEFLKEIGEPIFLEDTELLKSIAKTAMTGKSAEGGKEYLADLVVDAVKQVAEEYEDKFVVDKDNIKVEKKEGGSIEDTQLIKGIVLDKERVHSGMPKTVNNAKIALLDTALEIKKTETDAKINITDPMQLDSFIRQEEKMMKDMVENIKASGANVVLCQKGIDDLVQHYLAKAGIFAVRRIKKSDMEKLSKATGARIVTNLDDLTEGDLGTAGTVEEVKIAGDEMVFIKECANPKAVTIICRGGTEHVVDEIERAIEDAIDDVVAAIKCGYYVPGGGAIEVELAKRLRSYAETVGGKEQLAINAFAEALEVCPRTLAENAGLDPIDKLVAIRAAHDRPDGKWNGLDVFTGDVIDMKTPGVIEPMLLKSQAVKSASEVAEMILRIDDIVIAKELSKDESGPGGAGMPPGGYGGGYDDF